MGTTTIARLPYPAATDTADVPRDLAALANRADLWLDGLANYAAGSLVGAIAGTEGDAPGLSISITKPGTYLLLAQLDYSIEAATTIVTYLRAVGAAPIQMAGSAMGGGPAGRYVVAAHGVAVFAESPADSGAVAAGALVKVTLLRAAGTGATYNGTTSSLIAARVGV